MSLRLDRGVSLGQKVQKSEKNQFGDMEHTRRPFTVRGALYVGSNFVERPIMKSHGQGYIGSRQRPSP